MPQRRYPNSQVQFVHYRWQFLKVDLLLGHFRWSWKIHIVPFNFMTVLLPELPPIFHLQQIFKHSLTRIYATARRMSGIRALDCKKYPSSWLRLTQSRSKAFYRSLRRRHLQHQLTLNSKCKGPYPVETVCRRSRLWKPNDLCLYSLLHPRSKAKKLKVERTRRRDPRF